MHFVFFSDWLITGFTVAEAGFGAVTLINPNENKSIKKHPLQPDNLSVDRLHLHLCQILPAHTPATLLPLLSFLNDIEFRTSRLQRDPQPSQLQAMVHFLHAGQCSSFCPGCSGHQSTYCRLFSVPAHQS